MNDFAGTPILVVDDNAQNRALVEAALEEDGYRTVLVRSGSEALSAFAATPFDCVLLDVRMPEMDGFEVCRRLRALPHGGRTSIVFLTAVRDVETFDEALKAGGDDFLTKPLRPAELSVRVKAALQLRRLSDENRGYFATVREQRDALMRMQLQKEQLTAFLVHDLRNPLNSLDLQAQLLLKDKSLSEKGRDGVGAIRQEAQRLSRMIANMLDISRAEAGGLALVPVEIDATGLTRTLAKEFAGRAAAQGVQFVTELDLDSVYGDPVLVLRVLENLLDNAFRHAPAGSTVSLRGLRCDEHTVELRVSDQGTGVAPPMRETIFERYVQDAENQQRRAGYGLGLSFCKLAVAAHGGTIAVEESVSGATFLARLPTGRSPR